MKYEECCTCKNSFTTRKGRVYCKESLADKDDCGEYEMAIKALEQEPYEKFESTKDHIYKLAGDYKCWDNRLTEDEAVELYHILEQEPKTGHWIGIDEYPYEDYECDNCGFIHTFIDGHTAQYNYCPNCGARMRGENNADSN